MPDSQIPVPPTGSSYGQRKRFKSTFSGVLNNFENLFQCPDFWDVPITLDLLVVALNGDDSTNNPPTGADVKVDFYDINLSTGVKTLIGTVTVTAGTLLGQMAVSYVLAANHGVMGYVTQIGSTKAGSDASMIAWGTS